jgi:hypothetical protein
MDIETSQIFAHGVYGDRRLKEALSDLLVGMILGSDYGDLWLVSPWLSDFDLLDNRAGDWTAIQPAWGSRQVKFSELLVAVIQSGKKLQLVTNFDAMNKEFFERLADKLNNTNSIRWQQASSLHTKGFLTSSFFLSGSMNFTYSGTHKNDEQITLTVEPNLIMEARFEFEDRYQK